MQTTASLGGPHAHTCQTGDTELGSGAGDFPEVARGALSLALLLTYGEQFTSPDGEVTEPDRKNAVRVQVSEAWPGGASANPR